MIPATAPAASNAGSASGSERASSGARGLAAPAGVGVHGLAAPLRAEQAQTPPLESLPSSPGAAAEFLAAGLATGASGSVTAAAPRSGSDAAPAPRREDGFGMQPADFGMLAAGAPVILGPRVPEMYQSVAGRDPTPPRMASGLDLGQGPSIGAMPETDANYGMPQWVHMANQGAQATPVMQPQVLEPIFPMQQQHGAQHRKLGFYEQRLATTESTVAALVQRIEQLERQQRPGGEGYKREKTPMIDRKAFLTLQKNESTPKTLERWTFSFRAFLSQETGFEGYFWWAHNAETEPTDLDVAKLTRQYQNITWFDSQLYALLSALCINDDVAMSILQNSEKETLRRGALSWFKIVRHIKGKGTARQEELRKLVITEVPVATGYGDAQKLLETWERHLGEYELLTKTKVSDFDKVTTVCDMMPPSLRSDIQALEKTQYDDVYAYVSRQIVQRREDELRAVRRQRGGGSVAALQEDVPPVPVPESNELNSFQRGPRAPGQGAGATATTTAAAGVGMKQAFSGNCYNCNKPGHRAAECPEPRKPRSEQYGPGGPPKGGGKGNKGKGNFGGYGFGKGGATGKGAPLNWVDDYSYAMPAGSHGFRLSGMILEESDEEAMARQKFEAAVARQSAVGGRGASFVNENAFENLVDDDDYDLDELTQAMCTLESAIDEALEMDQLELGALSDALVNGDVREDGSKWLHECVPGTQRWIAERGSRSPIPGCGAKCGYNQYCVLSHGLDPDSLCRGDFSKYDARSGCEICPVAPVDEQVEKNDFETKGLGSDRLPQLTSTGRTVEREEDSNRPVHSRNPSASRSSSLRPAGSGTSGRFRRARWARRRQMKQQKQFDIDQPVEEMEAPTAEQARDMNGAIFGPQYAEAVRRREAFRAIPQPESYNSHLMLGPLYEQEDMRHGPSDQIFGMDWRSEHEGNWLRVDAVVDSGAAKPVAPPHMAPGHVIEDSPGSKAGKNFSAANGAPLPNLGQQQLSMYTDEGMETSVLFQLCDVTRPLLSVSAICDYGNRVVFGRGGGIIYNLDTGLEIPFARQGGIYSIGLWVCDKGSAGSTAAVAPASGDQSATPGFARPLRR